VRQLPHALLALTTVALTVATATPAEAASRPKGVPKAAITAQVKKVVDGDTIHVISRGRTLKVRLLEIDTPDWGQCWYNAATAKTKALLPVGKPVYLLRDRDPKDRYGRYLFYVWSHNGTFVNRYLVRYGYARAMLIKPNDKYIKLMRSEEAKAKRQKLRIWSGRCDKGGTAKPKTKGGTAKPKTKGGTAEPKTTARTGTDPRFRTCAEANRNGYGPYYRGRDPEYAWYQDRDGDGVVCER